MAAGAIVEWAFNFLKIDPEAPPTITEWISRVQNEHVECNSLEAAGARDIVLAVIRRQHAMQRTPIHAPTLEVSATPFQRLIVFVLSKISELGLRRCGDACYHQRLTATNLPTMAWLRTCSIREFVIEHTRRDVAPEQWRQLTNPRENLDALCKHLSEVDVYPEFPILHIDSGYISWDNGTYSIRDNLFWTNSSTEEDLRQMAADTQEERRAQGWGESYAVSLPEQGVSSCHIVPGDFRVCSMNREETSPNIARILQALRDVGIGDDVQWWFLALMGRLFFPMNKKEQWHIVPFIKTNDGNDQMFVGLFVSLLGHVFGTSAIGTIGAGANLVHSLEAIMNNRIAVLLMRDTPPMEQGDWQSATCGESVCISPRGRSSFSRQWTTHLLCVGSGMPYKNDAGTVERRVIMFDTSTADDVAVGTLREVLMHDADIFLQLCVENYLKATHRHSNADIWAVVPPAIQRQREALREIANPLYSCIRSRTLFEHGPTLYMPLSDFKDIYQSYRRTRGLQPQRWTRDHWYATFVELNLGIERGSRDYRGSRSTVDWVTGVDCVEATEKAAVITPEFVEQLKTEMEQSKAELERVTARHEAAKAILDIDESISCLKQRRALCRETFRKHNHPAAED